MAASLEETLISVWQQALVEDARTVKLENRIFPVRRTSRSKLREVDFQFEGHELRGLNRMLKRLLAGRDWREKERRSCSFCSNVGTSPLWLMEKYSSMAVHRSLIPSIEAKAPAVH